MYNYRKSMGPCVWKRSGKPRTAACVKSFDGGTIACVEYRYSPGNGEGPGVCTADRKNLREVLDRSVTPEWCPYLAGMMRDAEMGDFFAEQGLSAHKKKDALIIVRAMPKEHRPKRARDLDLMQLHNAIRRAWDAGWRMPDAAE